jgi:hypothetical protein
MCRDLKPIQFSCDTLGVLFDQMGNAVIHPPEDFSCSRHLRLRSVPRSMPNELKGAFSVGNLPLIGVLRRLKGSGLLEEYSNLAAYVARGEARPAFQRAFAAQLKAFTDLTGASSQTA